jgi:hypothetical protein
MRDTNCVWSYIATARDGGVEVSGPVEWFSRHLFAGEIGKILLTRVHDNEGKNITIPGGSAPSLVVVSMVKRGIKVRASNPLETVSLVVVPPGGSRGVTYQQKGVANCEKIALLNALVGAGYGWLAAVIEEGDGVNPTDHINMF